MNAFVLCCRVRVFNYESGGGGGDCEDINNEINKMRRKKTFYKMYGSVYAVNHIFPLPPSICFLYTYEECLVLLFYITQRTQVVKKSILICLYCAVGQWLH